jgi:hypothetical protein
MKKKIRVLKAVSVLLDKAIKPPVVTSSATNALKMYFLDEWFSLATPLIAKADGVKQTEESVSKFLEVCDTEMAKFAPTVKAEFEKYIEYFYKYSRNKFLQDSKLLKLKKADLPDSDPLLWTDKDQIAIDALKYISTEATGAFYTSSVQVAVADSVRRNMLEKQLPRDEAIEKLKADLQKALKIDAGMAVAEGFKGTADQYFTGLAESTASLSRVTGSVFVMEELEVKTLIVRSMRTNRTCEGCLAMDGTTYETVEAVKHIERLLGADSLDDLKEIQPSFHFDTPENMAKMGPDNAKSAALEQLKSVKDTNVMLPPFHFRCECYVDMA